MLQFYINMYCMLLVCYLQSVCSSIVKRAVFLRAILILQESWSVEASLSTQVYYWFSYFMYCQL